MNRTTTRPRGFIEGHRFYAKTLRLLERVKEVLDRYGDYLPLTVRQIFYIMVVQHGYEKTEKAYDRLDSNLVTFRRAREIPFEAIRDDGVQVDAPYHFDNESEYWDTVKDTADNFTLNHRLDQEKRVVVFCEAAGMVPQLGRVAKPFGIEVKSSGGFDGVGSKHQWGKEFAEENRPVVILHIGDYDPSGVHIYSSMTEDVIAFAQHYGGSVEAVRVAIIPEQIERFSLPTAPPKKGDKRKFDDDRTVQAEALTPDVMAEELKTEIEKHVDLKVLDESRDEQEEIRKRLKEKLRRIAE